MGQGPIQLVKYLRISRVEWEQAQYNCFISFYEYEMKNPLFRVKDLFWNQAHSKGEQKL